jgi:ABC-type Mn2+/Zn2+ transport system permease subunit
MLLTVPTLLFANLAAVGAIAIACGLLSVIVVSQRWAFVGEGISHAGFGGAGTAWILSLLIPALDSPWLAYTTIVLFCLATAVGISFISRQNRVSSDAAIGIFLVASLAWGFLAQQTYFRFRSSSPIGFNELLFGQMHELSSSFILSAVLTSAAVVLVVALLRKEIMAYCCDSMLAEVSGVRAGAVHYLLMLLLTLMILVGLRIMGSVLVTALLVLPAATAGLLARRLPALVRGSILIALISAFLGLGAHEVWRFVPVGPAIVLALFAQFLVAYTFGRRRRIF